MTAVWKGKVFTLKTKYWTAFKPWNWSWFVSVCATCMSD